MTGCSGQTRTFELIRHEDVTGISGTGVVAWGCQFPDGCAVLRWATQHSSTAVYNSIGDIEAIHGHEGRTEIRWTPHQVRDPFGDAATS